MSHAQGRRSPPRLVAGLGVTQLIAWATLYYGIAVLAEPIGVELGLTSSHVYGAFAWSMVISGVLAPWAGRTLDRRGGRAVLVSSALIGSVGFVALAHAQSFSSLLVGWSVLGLAMALGLYDTCFAAIGHVVPVSYRRTVTGVTLIAGFASTISWPATHQLVQSVGWRGACHVYALALLLCAPLYALVLPPDAAAKGGQAPAKLPARAEVSAATRRRAQLLAWAFAGTALVGSSLSAHLVNVLAALQLSRADAVWLAASIGVMQVAGRALELLFGSRLHPVRLGFVTFAGLVLAMMLLITVGVLPYSAYVFALAYGSANGLLTIAKATLPVELFGFANLGSVLGGFSAPSLVTRALAPFCFAVASSAVGTKQAVCGLLVVSLGSCAAYVATTRGERLRACAPSEI